jgi:hypothetical protein
MHKRPTSKFLSMWPFFVIVSLPGSSP